MNEKYESIAREVTKLLKRAINDAGDEYYTSIHYVRFITYVSSLSNFDIAVSLMLYSNGLPRFFTIEDITGVYKKEYAL